MIEASRGWRPLTGGTAIWVVMAVEVVTFGMFLIAHAASWSGQHTVYRASQQQLHVGSDTFGTLLLLAGSFTAYQAALSCEDGRARPAGVWMSATGLCGLLFCGNKLVEYSHLEGVGLSTNGFWFAYLFLTVCICCTSSRGSARSGASRPWRLRAAEPRAKTSSTCKRPRSTGTSSTWFGCCSSPSST